MRQVTRKARAETMGILVEVWLTLPQARESHSHAIDSKTSSTCTSYQPRDVLNIFLTEVVLLTSVRGLPGSPNPQHVTQVTILLCIGIDQLREHSKQEIRRKIHKFGRNARKTCTSASTIHGSFVKQTARILPLSRPSTLTSPH